MYHLHHLYRWFVYLFHFFIFKVFIFSRIVSCILKQNQLPDFSAHKSLSIEVLVSISIHLINLIKVCYVHSCWMCSAPRHLLALWLIRALTKMHKWMNEEKQHNMNNQKLLNLIANLWFIEYTNPNTQSYDTAGNN